MEYQILRYGISDIKTILTCKHMSISIINHLSIDNYWDKSVRPSSFFILENLQEGMVWQNYHLLIFSTKRLEVDTLLDMVFRNLSNLNIFVLEYWIRFLDRL